MLDPKIVSTCIYGTQAALAIWAIHGILYRLIAIDLRFRVADGGLFFGTLQRFQQGRGVESPEQTPRLEASAGWMRYLHGDASASQAATKIESLYSQSIAYISILTMVASVETLLGLLGTVAGFIVSDRVESISLSIAFGTTFCGIVASLPPTLYLYFTEPVRNRLHFQMQALLEASMQGPASSQTHSKSSAPVPAVSNVPKRETPPPVSNAAPVVSTEQEEKLAVRQGAVAQPSSRSIPAKLPSVRQKTAEIELSEFLDSQQAQKIFDL